MSVPLFGREGIMGGATARSALGRRVIAISQTRKAGGFAGGYLNAVPALLMMAAMLLTISMLSLPTGWSHDRLMLSTVVNLERLDRINSFGTQPLR